MRWKNGNLGSVGAGNYTRIERIFTDFVIGTFAAYRKTRNRARKPVLQRNAARRNAFGGAYRTAQNLDSAYNSAVWRFEKTTVLTEKCGKKAKQAKKTDDGV